MVEQAEYEIDGETFVYKALATKVMIVAVVNKGIGDWSAYCDACPGKSHEKEFKRIAETGVKIEKEVASFYFPSIAQKYKWRN